MTMMVLVTNRDRFGFADCCLSAVGDDMVCEEEPSMGSRPTMGGVDDVAMDEEDVSCEDIRGDHDVDGRQEDRSDPVTSMPIRHTLAHRRIAVYDGSDDVYAARCKGRANRKKRMKARFASRPFPPEWREIRETTIEGGWKRVEVWSEYHAIPIHASDGSVVHYLNGACRLSVDYAHVN